MGELAALFKWFLIATAALLAGFLLIVFVRRWMKQEPKTHSFTFQDLRELHASGQISDEEFKSMRNVLLGQLDARKNTSEDAATHDQTD